MQKINDRLMIRLKYMTTISLILLILISCSNEQLAESTTNENLQKISSAAIILNNTGVGQMGSFDYNKATLTFEYLLEQNQSWNLAQQNLAIALLNRQKQGDEDRAMSIAKNLIRLDPKNLVAQYIVAILQFNQGLCEQALPRFEIIVQADTTDAYALYFAGQCYLQNGKMEKALKYYQKAIEVDGYLRSAYYGSFMAAQRLTKNTLAEDMLNAYQKLDANPKARLAEIKYTRMGPKASAQVYLDGSENNINSEHKAIAPFFNAPRPILLKGIDDIENIGMVNLMQTETAQLYIVANNQLKIYQGVDTDTAELTKYSMNLGAGTHKIAWGDINNDNHIDVYITGKQDQLYLQTEYGFEKVNMQDFGLSQLSSSAVRLSDADHDGDLDVLLLSDLGVFEIWNNNLNNTFTALSTEISLPSSAGFVGIFVHDIDSDRDTDIILLAENHISILLNDRMWSYEILGLEEYKSDIISLTFADNNLNGIPEISLLFNDEKIISFEFDRRQKKLQETQRIIDIKADNMLQIDINGDSQGEYLLVNAKGLKILGSQGEILEQILTNNIRQIKVINTANGPELLLLGNNQNNQNNQLMHITASATRSPFVLLTLSGKEDGANSMRSNYSGIGTNLTVHNQSFYSIADSFHNLTGHDQDYQAITLAAGENHKIDFIEIQWSDGVYQTELGLNGQRHHKITETQRQLSSCPVIFAWNNGQYEFISDVLGVGGLGFAVGRNEYGVARPWENYLLNDKQLSADKGVFKLQFTEPMEESAYLDELQIQVIDVPKQWSVMLDERMMISVPVVTGETLFYQSIINPVQVVNKLGKDVTELVLSTDKKAIEIDNQDHRFLGLVDEQVITMEFSQELQGDYHFIMNGWVEYGYSQTMFAAWQAGVKAQAPTLEYKEAGEWKVLLSEFGYPAGMPRAATVPVTIPVATKFLRLTTNMEIYFDQLGLFQAAQPESIRQYDLKLQKARLYQLGFPKRSDNTQRVADYQFAERQPFWDTRYMEGAYTQLGDITELLKKKDNAVAIIGAGEAIELLYLDDLPEVAENFERYFMLQFKGWAKDMDILTQNGETLAPIPVNGTISKEAQALNQKYNSRFKAGK
ncbi:MAG: VCBS repeat-containing protein [Alcanivoracaceae bacterium]|nr:VCBS repeat-containing protein [Alcanivoracaceae bacterium]